MLKTKKCASCQFKIDAEHEAMIRDLKRDWDVLSGPERAIRIEKILKAGLSLRCLAPGLQKDESTLRKCLKMHLSPSLPSDAKPSAAIGESNLLPAATAVLPTVKVTRTTVAKLREELQAIAMILNASPIPEPTPVDLAVCLQQQVRWSEIYTSQFLQLANQKTAELKSISSLSNLVSVVPESGHIITDGGSRESDGDVFMETVCAEEHPGTFVPVP